jgi:hypothetical protein
MRKHMRLSFLVSFAFKWDVLLVGNIALEFLVVSTLLPALHEVIDRSGHFVIPALFRDPQISIRDRNEELAQTLALWPDEPKSRKIFLALPNGAEKYLSSFREAMSEFRNVLEQETRGDCLHSYFVEKVDEVITGLVESSYCNVRS